jgi:hypothetical protein
VLTADGFRPISLQNCVMKVVTRILTTRLQRFIERLISFEQSGFVKGRSIVDNFLYAADVIQSCQTRRTPAVVLKLDFKKAFDSVNWAALDAILEARGIGPLFRSWISTILSTGRTAILLNGVPGRWISCKNGLRQGDPLSPYLYLAVADLLPCLIAMESPEDRLLHPLVDDLPCPVIQYADDTLLILRAGRSQVRRLKTILDLFSPATGLHINFHKSTFVPVGGVPGDLASELAGILGCPVSSFPQTYLGLPLSDHKLPASALEFLSVKISKCIPGWRTSLLPIGGRLTLTDAVLSALPSFAMSVLPIPKGALVKMDRPGRAMFWKAQEKCSGGDCQVAWDYVCRLRSEGGLGITDLGLQNRCLLLKVLHGLFTGHDSPWTRWIRRSYLGDHPHAATPAWRSFQALIPLYRSITRVEPRDGRATSLWHDSWCPLGPLSTALPAAFSHCLRPLATVADALENGGIEIPLVHRLTAAASSEIDFVRTCFSRISLIGAPDARTVSLGPSVTFNTGDVYRALHSSGCVVPGQDTNWDCFAPLKVRVFFWILRLQKTRTRAMLHRLGCVPSPDCPFCPGHVESIAHLFVCCPRLRPVWNIV